MKNLTTPDEKPLVIFGEPDDKTIAQINRCMETPEAIRGVLCGDAHLGYSAPVGSAISYHDRVSISGVGYDIACGNKAVKTDAKWADIRSKLMLLADEISSRVAFGVGRSSVTQVDHPLFDDDAWKIPAIKRLKQMAREQLSSCGSSNHFLDIFIDDEDNVWIGCHFGSRGLGHKIATHYLLTAGGRDGIDVPPTTVNVNSSLGSEYVAGMNLAGRYAYAGRDTVCDIVVKDILKAKVLDQVHNHHNFAWQEEIDGQKHWIVRKGSTPCFPGQRSFVGGSMGDDSVILHGIDSQISRDALYSTVHGAGRLMSRTEAAGKSKWIFNEKLGRKVRTRIAEGKVNETSMRQKIKNMGIELRGSGPDEAPDVYRPLQSVLANHEGTIVVETRLHPKIVVMAGDGEFDQFKD